MCARDLHIGDRLWLLCKDRAVTIAGIASAGGGYLRIFYLEIGHCTEVHRDDPLVFQNGWRYL